MVTVLKRAIERSDLGPSDLLRRAAEQVMYDYETEGCEACGTISIGTLLALKRALGA